MAAVQGMQYKYGFCKFGKKCRKLHVKENCQNFNCLSEKCILSILQIWFILQISTLVKPKTYFEMENLKKLQTFEEKVYIKMKLLRK